MVDVKEREERRKQKENRVLPLFHESLFVCGKHMSDCKLS